MYLALGEREARRGREDQQVNDTWCDETRFARVDRAAAGQIAGWVVLGIWIHDATLNADRERC
jgi:hypothetical protein